MSKLFIKTYGCTLNKKDSLEVIKENEFFEDFKKISKADYVLINTCGVKEQTQTKIINFLKKIKEEKINQKKIIVFGCLVDIDREPLEKILPEARFFKVSQKTEIEKIIGKGNKKNKKKEISKTIVISNGCLGNCNYCAVKFARGKLISKPKGKIVKEIKEELKDKNVKEILLTSQDNACYGKDIKTNLIELLKDIIKINKDFKIRNGMGNPQHILPILDDLIDVYKSEKIYKFLHVPLQSGDNKVLKDMNRFYTVEEVLKIIKKFRKEIPEISISTDIIVGYPTENERGFKNTLKTIKKIKPDFLNISRFGQRKNIEANKHKDLLGKIKKERSRKITSEFEKMALENNKKFVGKIKEVIITEKGKNNTMIGKTKEYKAVVIKENIKYLEKIKVIIKKAEIYYLLGELYNPKKTR